MSKTRYINTKIWSDPWVVDHLNPLDRYLFLYFLTNEHTTIAGIYELSLRTMSSETGIEREELIRMLKRLEPRVKYLDGWVIVTNTIKNQNYNSPKIRTGIDMVLERSPEFVLEHIKWPEDYEKPKGREAKQQRLVMGDSSDFDNGNDKAKPRGISSKNRAKSYNTPVPNLTTPAPVIYGIDTLSHSNTNVKAKSKTTVRADTAGKNYLEITALYDELSGLVNDQFKAWYCQAFFKLGRQRVYVLASQAKADGKDPKKLFSHLLQKESGLKREVTA